MLYEPHYGHHRQLRWNLHQSLTEYRAAWQRLSHQFRFLRGWCCNGIVDLEETV